ncbi:hypothetical protein [Halalkalibacter oceani]|uniref:hypothetical protein n=1 Tax=Halalkalibacter oceani TaxID=1653776 RepID=UPI0033977E23
MEPVTLWYRKTKENKLSFNHLEVGHSQYEKAQPIKPEYTNQSAWQKDQREKKLVYMENGVVIK